MLLFLLSIALSLKLAINLRCSLRLWMIHSWSNYLHHTVMHHVWKTFGCAAITPLTESYQLIQKGSCWVATNRHWQHPAIDWCYSHEEAFKKMRFQCLNIQSLMDCNSTFHLYGRQGIGLLLIFRLIFPALGAHTDWVEGLFFKSDNQEHLLLSLFFPLCYRRYHVLFQVMHLDLRIKRRVKKTPKKLHC